MINQQLLDYMRQDLAAGTSPDGIRQKLRTQGWSDADIDAGLHMVAPGLPATTTTVREVPLVVKVIAWIYGIGAILGTLFALFGTAFVTVAIPASERPVLLIMVSCICLVYLIVPYSLYQGKNWARVLILVFAWIGLVSGAIYILLSFVGNIPTITNIVSTVINGALVYYLGYNPEVRQAFLGK